MKTATLIILTFYSLYLSAQNKQSVSLEWKIGAEKKLVYKTDMSDIDSSEFSFNTFPDFFSDSTGGSSKAQDFFKQLAQSINNKNYITTLSNKGNGVVDIVMTAQPKTGSDNENNDTVNSEESKVDELLRMMQKMSGGAILRGSVYAKGGIHSFWVISKQKNLISLFFELPKKPVRVGDSWELDVNLISNDQNFICDSSHKHNKVTLSEIKKINGENIAVIKYDIAEYVKGTFTAFGTPSGTMMHFTHVAIAEFSIDRGRWISYSGIMNLDATGVMTARKKTKFVLVAE